ncbi:hydroxyethylthiazole kinase [Arthrobacter sp. MYb227]|uniref:hydroxyethylthiazole kinase n=1 Tax=Arthrobacter sp. MYb227 TaxID=1848601 RepID=UPI000CFC39EF|nr:hydroxyethylthiazole kinase [Arthrobacter sp. MYb227]PQZ90225.1 hydroxyethylthiazole kinase [Arthrobacter sp. MYb227]
MVSIAPSFVINTSELANCLARLRASTPLIQCLTNTVVTNFTANVLLAAGASPAMADLPGEAGDFATIASGTLINLGTPYAEQRNGFLEAVAAANSSRTPWVLDPVAIGSLKIRTELAFELRSLDPTVIRGNASEIMVLADSGSGGRGVDSTDTVTVAAQHARDLALRSGAVVAVSGQEDLITDGTRNVLVHGGSDMLTRVTGGGCALGAMVAAFLSVHDDPLVATVAAHAFYSAAAERAVLISDGPGSFAMNFIDSLHLVQPQELKDKAVLS